MEKLDIYSHRRNISSNCLFINFFCKNVVFTKFLSKTRESNFCKFSATHATIFFQKFRQINCFTKETKSYTVNQFNEKFFQWGKFAKLLCTYTEFSHTQNTVWKSTVKCDHAQCGNFRIFPHCKIFSSN